jgi:hypothetical protein
MVKRGLFASAIGVALLLAIKQDHLSIRLSLGGKPNFAMETNDDKVGPSCYLRR